MQINFNLMQISRKAGTAGDKRILLIFLGKTQELQLLSIPILRISTFTSQGPFSEFPVTPLGSRQGHQGKLLECFGP